MQKTIAGILFLLIPLGIFGQARYIHVVVALCDNVNQGIVPVPKKIGNGQDPANNLYWGCAFGVKTFFKKQADWKLLKQIKDPAAQIYERLVFKHEKFPVYMVADAYDGAAIRQTIVDFLDYAAGLKKMQINAAGQKIAAGGSADLICYVGHDGLMDFSLNSHPAPADVKTREVMILACASKNYFSAAIKKTGARPLLWTTGLMCPEAYTLAAAMDAWIKNEPGEKIEEAAAQTYHQYQKCGMKAARNLFAAGY